MEIVTYMREAKRFDNHRPEAMLDALAHGLMAEVGEVVDCVARADYGRDFLAECGDVAWNLARLADEVGYTPALLGERSWSPPHGGVHAKDDLVLFASRVSGLMEKSHRVPHANQAPFDYEYLRHAVGHFVHRAWLVLTVLAERHGFDMEQVMQANITKLHARHAERGLPVKEAT